MLGCSQTKKRDFREKAIDVPVKKVLFARFKETNPNKERYNKELLLVRKTGSGQTILEYTDPLGVDVVRESVTTFKQAQRFILYNSDTCTYIDQLHILSEKDTTELFLYSYDLASVIDEEAIVALDEDKELVIMYNYAWGIIHTYDSHKKSKAHFDTLVEQVVSYPLQKINNENTK
jgi:hypothetical protein